MRGNSPETAENGRSSDLNTKWPPQQRSVPCPDTLKQIRTAIFQALCSRGLLRDYHSVALTPCAIIIQSFHSAVEHEGFFSQRRENCNNHLLLVFNCPLPVCGRRWRLVTMHRFLQANLFFSHVLLLSHIYFHYKQ